jgi:hypothetical protein
MDDRLSSQGWHPAYGADQPSSEPPAEESRRRGERRNPMTFDQLKDNWNQENRPSQGDRYDQSRENRFAGNYTRSGGRLPPPRRIDQSAGCEFL